MFAGNPQVTLVGGLVAPPEVIFTTAGHALATFTIVTVDRKRQDSGAWEDIDKTYWDCVAWRRVAENLADSDLKPGDKVIAWGKVKAEHWETKEGDKRTKMKFVADHVGVALDYNAVTVKRVDRSTSAPPVDAFAATAPTEAPF